jgi:thioredoxin-like negative regulator of GroEL
MTTAHATSGDGPGTAAGHDENGYAAENVTDDAATVEDVAVEDAHACDVRRIEGLLQSGRVLVEFSAGWVLTAQMLRTQLEQAGVELLRVDVDSHPGIADRFAVQLLPCYVRLVGGREQARRVGATSASELAAM